MTSPTPPVRPSRRFTSGRRLLAAAACLAGVLGTALPTAPAVRADSDTRDAPARTACPSGLGGKATCYTGQDTTGAYGCRHRAMRGSAHRTICGRDTGGPGLVTID